MRVLGIDPGVATTGWAIVDFEGKSISVVDFGVILTTKEKEQEERLLEIYNDLNQIINLFKPEYAGVELLLFTNNAKTAMKVGEARGVILLALANSNLNIKQMTPPQIKNSISGSGRADKKQVQENVKRLCNLKELPKPDDAADAIAIAVSCYDRIKVEQNVLKIK